MKQLAVATNEIGDVMTSSPGRMPATWASRCRPVVPLETAAANGAPTRAARCSSKRSIAGPSDSRPERSTSRTSSSSRSPRNGRESGMRWAGGLGLVCKAELRARGLGRAELDALEPVVPARIALAADEVEVRSLQLLRDRSDPELVVVDRPDRRHLGRGAAPEHLVRQVEVPPDPGRLRDIVP